MADNKTILIASLLLLGGSALYVSMNNQSKEGYAGGMPQRAAQIEKLLVPISKGALKGSRGGSSQPNFQGAKSVNFANFTNVQQSPQVSYPYQGAPVMEPYQGPQQMLGSSANTTQPYVTIPNFQQSVPQRAPSVQYSSFERYKPTSLSNMGRTSDFNCKGGSSEGYAQTMEGFDDTPDQDAASYPGPDYSAGNYKSLVPQSAPDVAADLASTMDVLSPTGDVSQVLVYDRPYTVNLKPGRCSRVSNCVDRIRGDIPINVSDTQNGWFQSSSGPADLIVGSLSQIAGVNEADHVLRSLKAAYGASNAKVGAAKADFNYQSMQYANMQSSLGDTTNIYSAAFP